MSLHCWKGHVEHLEDVHGWGTDPYWDAVIVDGAWVDDGTCMLDSGHDGEHDFTPDGQIVVAFAPGSR